MDKLLTRYLDQFLLEQSEHFEKMLFISGPRQVGKSTLLHQLAAHLGYNEKDIFEFNWDRREDQAIIRQPNFSHFRNIIQNSSKKPLFIFDEIHKFHTWKTFLKGFFDTFKNKAIILVTGSARLDIYRRGGDSMLGRYWLYHLFPLSLSEVLRNSHFEPFEEFIQNTRCSVKEIEAYQNLFTYGGFPEPYFKASKLYHNRWINLRRERLVKEDLRDLSNIQDLAHVDHLMRKLELSVGSVFSINSVQEDVAVTHKTISNYLNWLESIHYCFRLTPYSKKISRALKKGPKYYLYDWSELKDEGSRFENLIAVHLKKSVDFWTESGFGNYKLQYVRDAQKHEVDFLILKEEKPWILIEAKLSEDKVPNGLIYMGERLKPKYRVLVNNTSEKGEYRFVGKTPYWVSGAAHFLKNFI